MKKLFTVISIIAFTIMKSQTPALNWVKGFYGGTGKACSVKTDNNGNIYITGNFMGIMDFDPSPSTATLQAWGNSDIYIAKYDISGNYIWAKCIGGTSALDYARAMTLDNSGNIYLTGSTDGNSDFDPSSGVATLSTSTQHMYFAKYDNNGNYLFAKILQGFSSDEGLAISLDNTGNIYIAGNKSGQTDFDPSSGSAVINTVGNTDGYLAKYDNLGNYQWALNIGSSLNDYAYSVVCDASNDVTVAGEFRNVINFDPIGGGSSGSLTSNNQGDGFVAKYQPNGHLIWAKKIGGITRGMSLDPSGNLFLCGEYGNNDDFDPSATTYTLAESGNGGAFVAKYDGNLNLAWAKGFTGANNEWASSLVTDATGNVYSAGHTYGTIDLDPTAGTNTLISNGSSDFFVLGLNGNGNVMFANLYGGPSGDNSNSLAIHGTNLINLGNFTQIVDFDPAVTTATLYTTGGADAFLQNLSVAAFVSGIEESDSPEQLSMYPNPSSGSIFIVGETKQEFDLVVSDVSGRIVLEKQSCKQGEELKLNLNEGVYICTLSTKNQKPITKKLIIQ